MEIDRNQINRKANYYPIGCRPWEGCTWWERGHWNWLRKNRADHRPATRGTSTCHWWGFSHSKYRPGKSTLVQHRQSPGAFSGLPDWRWCRVRTGDCSPDIWRQYPAAVRRRRRPNRAPNSSDRYNAVESEFS